MTAAVVTRHENLKVTGRSSRGQDLELLGEWMGAGNIPQAHEKCHTQYQIKQLRGLPANVGHGSKAIKKGTLDPRCNRGVLSWGQMEPPAQC